MTSRLKFRLGFWLLVLLLIGALYGWKMIRRGSRVPTEVSTANSLDKHPIPLPEFKLTERSGREFDSNELKGQIWIGSFFFASCPGPCRKMNLKLAELTDEWPADKVRFVSISVDPKNDSPAALQDYAKSFGADDEQWLFLTEPGDDVQKLARQGFKVAASTSGDSAAADHPITHSDRLIVIDGRGQIRGYFSATDDVSVALLKRKVNQLLEEPQ